CVRLSLVFHQFLVLPAPPAPHALPLHDALPISAYQGALRREVELNPTLASENFQFLREAVLGGLGIGLVPDYVVADDIAAGRVVDRKSTRLNSSHVKISYAVFCLKKKKRSLKLS